MSIRLLHWISHVGICSQLRHYQILGIIVKRVTYVLHNHLSIYSVNSEDKRYTDHHASDSADLKPGEHIAILRTCYYEGNACREMGEIRFSGMQWVNSAGLRHDSHGFKLVTAFQVQIPSNGVAGKHYTASDTSASLLIDTSWLQHCVSRSNFIALDQLCVKQHSLKKKNHATVS